MSINFIRREWLKLSTKRFPASLSPTHFPRPLVPNSKSLCKFCSRGFLFNRKQYSPWRDKQRLLGEALACRNDGRHTKQLWKVYRAQQEPRKQIILSWLVSFIAVPSWIEIEWPSVLCPEKNSLAERCEFYLFTSFIIYLCTYFNDPLPFSSTGN